jgi:hypothetical protein
VKQDEITMKLKLWNEAVDTIVVVGDRITISNVEVDG